MLEWLMAPIDLVRPHHISFEVSWHARLMVFSWSVLVPLGIFAARFFKVLPKQNWPEKLDNQTWWYTHLVAQYAAMSLLIIAVVLIWNASGSHEGAFLHQFVGWGTLGLCGFQVLAGWLRGSKGGPSEIAKTGSIRGDHFDMTFRRRAFEYFHKYVGYMCVFCAIIAVFSGLWLVNAPHWMWLILVLWWGVVIFSFIRFQKRFGVYDTYQAIWGVDPDLPGNQLQPIGIAIKNPQQAPDGQTDKSNSL